MIYPDLTVSGAEQCLDFCRTKWSTWPWRAGADWVTRFTMVRWGLGGAAHHQVRQEEV
jgi:hypothetical protein